MADYEGIDTTDYEEETFQAYSFEPMLLQKREVWVAAETARSPTITITGTNIVPIYRGTIGNTFVFNVGSPPAGAINIVIIGETVQ